MNPLESWFIANVLPAILDKLTSPQVIAKITEGVTEGIVLALLPKFDGQFAHSTAEADRMIATTAANIAAGTTNVISHVSSEVNAVATTIANNTNSVINTLFGNLKNLIPFHL